jgi:hypothetical protein
VAPALVKDQLVSIQIHSSLSNNNPPPWVSVSRFQALKVVLLSLCLLPWTFVQDADGMLLQTPASRKTANCWRKILAKHWPHDFSSCMFHGNT